MTQSLSPKWPWLCLPSDGFTTVWNGSVWRNADILSKRFVDKIIFHFSADYVEYYDEQCIVLYYWNNSRTCILIEFLTQKFRKFTNSFWQSA